MKIKANVNLRGMKKQINSEGHGCGIIEDIWGINECNVCFGGLLL